AFGDLYAAPGHYRLSKKVATNPMLIRTSTPSSHYLWRCIAPGGLHQALCCGPGGMDPAERAVITDLTHTRVRLAATYSDFCLVGGRSSGPGGHAGQRLAVPAAAGIAGSHWARTTPAQEQRVCRCTRAAYRRLYRDCLWPARAVRGQPGTGAGRL